MLPQPVEVEKGTGVYDLQNQGGTKHQKKKTHRKRTSEKANEISVAGINPCHALSADMKALKILNFMYKEAIQHEIINPEDFTGQETLSSE